MQSTKSNAAWIPPPNKLDLQPHQVDIWRVSLNLPTATVKSLESFLSADESLRAARFHFPADRDRYIIAHGCLRDVLARYLNCEPDQINFSTNPYGKPELQNHNLEFNLSHSGDFALIAVTRKHKVGIDVELLRDDLEIESIAHRYFSQNEMTELMALQPEERVAGFFNCWTRKEAYIKAQGLGLSLPLDSFDVSLSPNKPTILRAARPDPQEATRWRLLSLDVDSDYAAAAVVEMAVPEFRLWDFMG